MAAQAEGGGAPLHVIMVPVGASSGRAVSLLTAERFRYSFGNALGAPRGLITCDSGGA